MTQAELKTHYSAAELAEMKLPSLPGTIQGIGIRAKAEQWESKKRQGRGGGYEYALSSLPAAASRAIKDRLVTSMIAAPAVSVPVLPMKAQQMELALTSRQQTVEGARKGVLVAIERLMAGCGVITRTYTWRDAVFNLRVKWPGPEPRRVDPFMTGRIEVLPGVLA